MEARYNCVEAIYKALSSSSKFLNDPALSGTAEKVGFLFSSTTCVHLWQTLSIYKVFIYFFNCSWWRLLERAHILRKEDKGKPNLRWQQLTDFSFFLMLKSGCWSQPKLFTVYDTDTKCCSRTKFGGLNSLMSFSDAGRRYIDNICFVSVYYAVLVYICI